MKTFKLVSAFSVLAFSTLMMTSVTAASIPEDRIDTLRQAPINVEP
ncbi:MAG: nitrate reductase cytochrome c-type subunit, partial [Shewanella sp.]